MTVLEHGAECFAIVSRFVGRSATRTEIVGAARVRVEHAVGVRADPRMRDPYVCTVLAASRLRRVGLPPLESGMLCIVQRASLYRAHDADDRAAFAAIVKTYWP